MDAQRHWDRVYETKAPDAVSWYRPHLEISCAMIERAAGGDARARVIDVGGGASSLPEDLLERGYGNVTVLDISAAALKVAQERMGEERARRVKWVCGDVTQVELERHGYDVWHDRAVFHFLTREEDRVAYVRQVAAAVRPGGHVIVSTFATDGPKQCSGLDVVRYEAETLHGEFGGRFRLVESRKEGHETPWGSRQEFVYCYCTVEG